MHKENQSKTVKNFSKKICNTQFIIVLVLYGALALIVLRKFLFQPGVIGHNWDWSISPMPTQLRYRANELFYVWSGSSFGGPVAARLPFSFWSLFLNSFGYLGLSGDFVSKFLLFFIIVLSGTSMFYLLCDILKRDVGWSNPNFKIFFSSLLAGFFYALSPFIFAEFIGGANTQFFAYSIIPLALYFFRKMAFNGVKLKHIFLFTIFLSLLSVSFQSFILVAIILLLYTTIQRKRIRIMTGLLLSFLLLYISKFLLDNS